MATMISSAGKLMGILVLLSHSECYIRCKVDGMVLKPDVPNNSWNFLFDDPNYVNDQNSRESGIPINDQQNEAERLRFLLSVKPRQQFLFEELMMRGENINELRPEG